MNRDYNGARVLNSPPMAVKVKGLLKGLQCIAQVFEIDREEELSIGYPMDVKHLAHIGWDGTSANQPTWMNQFNEISYDEAVTPIKSPSHGIQDPVPQTIACKSKTYISNESSKLDSPSRSSPGAPRHSHRRKTKGSEYRSALAGKGRKDRGSQTDAFLDNITDSNHFL